MSGRVEAVCLVHADRPNHRGAQTAIDKRQVEHPVRIKTLGPMGDHVGDRRHHGGVDQAVYAYAEEEASRWAEELGRPVPAGYFGENLRLSGVAVTDAVVGSHWSIGSALLEVTAPRIPCATFQHWTGEAQWVKRFTARGDVGTYLRVLTEGTVGSGDDVDVVHVPAHGVTVRELFALHDLDRVAPLLDHPNLAAGERSRIQKALRRTAAR
ncbi:MAG TPA: MOSC domain-containing protein [Aldersonia sp.]